VVGLVVQPGVEFDHDSVVDYKEDKARTLSQEIEKYPQMVFEAHSTDYQTPQNLRALVRDHFAILKVGPALTYALRESFWALDQIEQEWLGEEKAVGLRRTVMDAMMRDATYWKKYYTSTGTQLSLDLQYSLSDRIRYYWPATSVSDAAARLIKSLQASPPPLTLIMQFLPGQYAAIRNKEICNNPKELVMHKVDEVLMQYSNACNPGSQCLS
jgi:D-tagatose-1,6-bisphosphate aldolase subunit GatZ/KbaZ